MGTNLLLRTQVVTYNSYHFVGHCSAFYGLKKKQIGGLRYILARSHARVMVQTVFQSFCFVHIFLKPSKVMMIVIQFILLGANFNTLSRDQNIFRETRTLLFYQHDYKCMSITFHHLITPCPLNFFLLIHKWMKPNTEGSRQIGFKYWPSIF